MARATIPTHHMTNNNPVTDVLFAQVGHTQPAHKSAPESLQPEQQLRAQMPRWAIIFVALCGVLTFKFWMETGHNTQLARKSAATPAPKIIIECKTLSEAELSNTDPFTKAEYTIIDSKRMVAPITFTSGPFYPFPLISALHNKSEPVLATYYSDLRSSDRIRLHKRTEGLSLKHLLIIELKKIATCRELGAELCISPKGTMEDIIH